jgi:hypothetical protein
VVVTNQINATPDSQEMFGNPIGGNAMSHVVTYSIRLGTRNHSHNCEKECDGYTQRQGDRFTRK